MTKKELIEALKHFGDDVVICIAAFNCNGDEMEPCIVEKIEGHIDSKQGAIIILR